VVRGKTRRFAVAPGLEQHAAHDGHAVTMGPYQRTRLFIRTPTFASLIPARDGRLRVHAAGVTKPAGLATIDESSGDNQE